MTVWAPPVRGTPENRQLGTVWPRREDWLVLVPGLGTELDGVLSGRAAGVVVVDI